MRRIKVVAGSVVAWLALLVVGGAAIAGAVGRPAAKGDPPGRAISFQARSGHPDATDAGLASELTPTVGAELTPTVGAGAPNHGQCVSHAAAEAKDLGFAGRARGAMVSTIAKGDGVGPDCDLSAGIAAAQAVQAAQGAQSSDEDGGEGHQKAKGQGHQKGKGEGHTESD